MNFSQKMPLYVFYSMVQKKSKMTKNSNQRGPALTSLKNKPQLVHWVIVVFFSPKVVSHDPRTIRLRRSLTDMYFFLQTVTRTETEISIVTGENRNWSGTRAGWARRAIAKSIGLRVWSWTCTIQDMASWLIESTSRARKLSTVIGVWFDYRKEKHWRVVEVTAEHKPNLGVWGVGGAVSPPPPPPQAGSPPQTRISDLKNSLETSCKIGFWASVRLYYMKI